MKQICAVFLIFMLLGSSVAAACQNGEQSLALDTVLYADLPAAEKPLRLHVLANSDSAWDQQVKLAVRDQVLALLAERLADCSDKEQAMAVVSAALPEVMQTCDSFLEQQGIQYRSAARLEQTDFPAIAYNDVVFAAGEYDALRVVLGSGKGHNWWCVLFPPLCFVDLVAEADVPAVAAMAGESVHDGYRLGFKLNELFTDRSASGAR